MRFLSFLSLAVFFFFSSCNPKPLPKVLIFSKTAGYRHSSIEAGRVAIAKLGQENGFLLDSTENSALFTEENLKQYAAVIFLNTTGDVLDYIQQADFERYIQAGGGFVGVHSAADTEYDWIWYGKLIGGYFNGHPNIQDAEIEVVDHNHPSTKMLPDVWSRKDEWYNYKALNGNVSTLLNLDETSYKGGTNGDNHPIAWYHNYDGGRAFYTGGGHTEESYSEALFLQHLLGGIQYAIGDNKRDYSLSHFERVPEENRFVKTVLARNLNEPMELDVFPNGNIILVERRGAIKLYKAKPERLDSLTTFPVFSGEEDGLLGIAIDPNYSENKWIYLFYSPVGPVAKQHVSRFIFDGDSLHYASEKVVLEIETQRKECCHSGGSLEFGPDGHLFITTGDNTNPFESDGFAPTDERKGRAAWDAQRTSGNTNDLRGKILRIKPLADGTYAIPEGNLFPKGTPNTRPEIYVMGCRNPFRMGIDAKTGYLYWGDVGPDSGADVAERGPMGYDEINQARTAGNFGWPYFRGDKKVYYDYDFATKKNKGLFDINNPTNDSPNNTGLTTLPPFQPSMIWYSYDTSKEFPWVGNGGKNPMAGPVYYSDAYQSETKLPDFFDGRLFVYEWMRHWIYTIQFDSTGAPIKIDPFMRDKTFSRPMDMVIGPDGHLYMLEYGQLWFARNMDAQLVRIDYITGNRAPVAQIEVNKSVGAAPFPVLFSAEKSYDFDKDKLSYEWNFGDGSPINANRSPSHTFQRPGIYSVKLKVTDKEGQVSEASQEIQVGNEAPEVVFTLNGNQTFYWDKRSFEYEVQVSDKEDGQLSNGSIKEEAVLVSLSYLPQGYDLTMSAQGHQSNPGNYEPTGKKLMDGSDCKSCHAMDKKVNGPSYLDIAKRYQSNEFAARELSKSIIYGTSGKWGSTAMVAHPQLTEEEATEIALYILSLGEAPKVNSVFPVKGKYVTDTHIGREEKGSYVLMASYTDRGNANIQSITGREQILLRHPKIKASSFSDSSKDLRTDGDAVIEIYNGSFLVYEDLDMTDIGAIKLDFWIREHKDYGGKVELRLDGKQGQLLGTYDITESGVGTISFISTTLTSATLNDRNASSDAKGLHDVYALFSSSAGGDKQIVHFKSLEFIPAEKALQ
jgi:cytochrome c